MAATRPQITRKFVNSKHPDASASPYSHAYSPCAQAAQAASLSDPHIASKSITRFGMPHPRDRAKLILVSRPYPDRRTTARRLNEDPISSRRQRRIRRSDLSRTTTAFIFKSEI